MVHYRARRTINSPHGGLIMPGGVVPEDHPRIRDGLRKGFIERVDGDPAPTPPPPAEPERGDLPETEGWPPTPPEEKARLASIAAGATVFKGPSVSEAATPPADPHTEADPEMPISALPFMARKAIETLEAVGVTTVRHIRGWTREGLVNVPNIGPATADKLLAAYHDACEP